MDETAVERATAPAKANVAAELRRQAATLLELADRIDPPAPPPGDDTEVPGPSQGSVMVAAERLRQIRDEGHQPAVDATLEGNELAWAAFSYVERAAQNRLDQDDPSIPHVWPLARPRWKPKKSRVRNLVVAAALIVAEIDRLLAANERP